MKYQLFTGFIYIISELMGNLLDIKMGVNVVFTIILTKDTI